MRKIVFLDRDGVLTVPSEVNGKGFAPRTTQDLTFYPDAGDSVTKLKRAGFEVVVVTNQPDVGDGFISSETLKEMNAIVESETGVDCVRVCPHSKSDGCLCRKPKNGLIEAELLTRPVDRNQSWMVGDRDSDILAGLASGLATVFIERGWSDESGSVSSWSAKSLGEATEIILRQASS